MSSLERNTETPGRSLWIKCILAAPGKSSFVAPLGAGTGADVKPFEGRLTAEESGADGRQERCGDHGGGGVGNSDQKWLRALPQLISKSRIKAKRVAREIVKPMKPSDDPLIYGNTTDHRAKCLTISARPKGGILSDVLPIRFNRVMQ